jgi:hypothetical protein
MYHANEAQNATPSAARPTNERASDRASVGSFSMFAYSYLVVRYGASSAVRQALAGGGS